MGDDSSSSQPQVSESTKRNALPVNHLYQVLLPRYSLGILEAALHWLEIGEYVQYSGWGLHAPRQVISLAPKGCRLADEGSLAEPERALVYQEDLYLVFVARQFSTDDSPLFTFLADAVLAPLGFRAIDGRDDGVEAFRGEILRKIRLSRYFVCVLTRREQLLDGAFASSVWLYQETGAAVALGKRPLILVEDGIGEHFAGELQKNYEYIPFARTGFESAFGEVGRRLQNDLDANAIPRPTAKAI